MTFIAGLLSPLPVWPCTWQFLKGWKIKPKDEIGGLLVYLDVYIIKFDHRLENTHINGKESCTVPVSAGAVLLWPHTEWLSFLSILLCIFQENLLGTCYNGREITNFVLFKCYVRCIYQIRSDQSLSCVRLCDPMNRSTPGLPVHHQLPEFT